MHGNNVLQGSLCSQLHGVLLILVRLRLPGQLAVGPVDDRLDARRIPGQLPAQLETLSRVSGTGQRHVAILPQLKMVLGHGHQDRVSTAIRRLTEEKDGKHSKPFQELSPLFTLNEWMNTCTIDSSLIDPPCGSNNRLALLQWTPLIVASSGLAISGHNNRWLLYPSVF